MHETRADSDVVRDESGPFVVSDAPLEETRQDELDRAPLAQRLARCIMTVDAKNGFTLGLQGSWGTGKTTLANFIMDCLRKDESKPIVVSFNPWWFRNKEELMLSFFSELSAAIGRSEPSKQLDGASKKMQYFAGLLTPLQYTPKLGAVARIAKNILEKLSRVLGHIKNEYEEDIQGTREDIVNELQLQNRRIVVFIDDLDRLESAELKQVFAIIKAAASFPNVVYVLMYDVDRTAKILRSADEQDPYAYLEKIVQMSLNIPASTPGQLQRIVLSRLSSILHIPIETDEWQSIVERTYLVILPMLRTIRDINRFTNGLSFTYPGIKEEVDTLDFLLIEFLRIFVPDIYEHIRNNPSLYAGQLYQHESKNEGSRADLKQRIERALESAVPRDREHVLKLLKSLSRKVSFCFEENYSASWRLEEYRDKRFDRDPRAFPLYFHITPPSGHFGEADFRALMATTDDSERFEEALRQLDSQPDMTGQESRLPDALDMLHAHDEGGFRPLDAYQGFLALANIFDIASVLPRIALINNEWRIEYLVADILRSHPRRGELFRTVCQETKSLYACVELVDHYERIYNKSAEGSGDVPELLLDNHDIAKAKIVVLSRLHQATTDDSLAEHPALMRILHEWDCWEPDAVKAYTTSISKDSDGLVHFLNKHFESGIVVSHPDTDGIMKSLAAITDFSRFKALARDVLAERIDNIDDLTRIRLQMVVNFTATDAI